MTPIGRPWRILLIEDNEGDLFLFKEALSRSRFHTELDHTANGYHALDLLHQKGKYRTASLPDLVLLDLSLNEIDGFALLRSIKGDDRLSSIPIVVFTGSDMPEDIRKAYLCGCNGYVVKPTGLDKLERVIDDLQGFWFETCRIPSAQ